MVSVPPFRLPGVKLTLTWPAPAVAVPMTGAAGGPEADVGVAQLEAPDQGLVPRLVTVRAQQR